MSRILTPAQQAELGRAVLTARSATPPAPWKLLVNVYARSRAQLWRYARLVGAEKDVSSGQMKHHRPSHPRQNAI